ncbi:MAG: HlyD family efflux transporter periplasmic adaptor subunit [Candidatus Aminicenantes bacterium]|nr:HlyD family efflux transporter periplasmic adaptor subunit [Candidatus Aminicenantes bacterium]
MKRGPAVFLLLIASAACGGRNDSNEILLTGSVESDPVRISPLVGGRLLELDAVEGAKIKAGEIVARIDPTDLELQLKQAETMVRAGDAQLALILKGVRSEDLATAREQVVQAEIAAEKYERERARLDRLYKEGSIAAKDLDDMIVLADQAKSRLEQARKQDEKARSGARKEEIEAARAARDQAAAAADILRKKIADCLVVSPLDGTVLHRLAEPGEVVAPGATLATIAGLDTVKITAFITEADMGFISPGMAAEIRTDSHDGRTFAATVSRIADEAEFTPKTIQTRDERVKTVYRIELTAKNDLGIFKPGMPVDVILKHD